MAVPRSPHPRKGVTPAEQLASRRGREVEQLRAELEKLRADGNEDVRAVAEACAGVVDGTAAQPVRHEYAVRRLRERFADRIADLAARETTVAETTRDDAESVDALRQTDERGSWYNDAPITDQQLNGIRRDLDTPFGPREAPFAPFVVRKLVAALDSARAQLAGLTDEYGLLIHHLDTTTSEGAIAPSLAEALEVLEAFDASSGPGVLSRTLRVRPVGPWKDAREANRG